MFAYRLFQVDFRTCAVKSTCKFLRVQHWSTSYKIRGNKVLSLFACIPIKTNSIRAILKSIRAGSSKHLDKLNCPSCFAQLREAFIRGRR